ncbi:MAG: hypothetical protein DWQ04_07000 [Chloroflexi bacterium]|nr:MAG: hypothetical protein DWQ04_07000 [Chloroflexota bacterium]
MLASLPAFTEGDWIVHRQYGIGQIKKREEKTISGRCEEYYRVQTPDSVVWLPVNKLDQSWFRPIATPTDFHEAINILQKPPNQMDANFMNRKDRINRVQTENSIPAIAQLIRDLCGRRSHKSLSDTEQRALRHLTERFIAEWSVSTNIDISMARNQFNGFINGTQRQLIN